MKTWKKLTLCSLLVFSFVLVFGASVADAKKKQKGPIADVVLYEVWENVTIDFQGLKIVRDAKLQGVAQPGTPLCPATETQPCAVTAEGTNTVFLDATELAQGKIVPTGVITAAGTFTVVSQFDNPIDAPEFVLGGGTFSGTVDPTILGGVLPATKKKIAKTIAGLDFLPLLGISGQFTTGNATPSFTGTFRLPFSLSHGGKKMKPRHGKDAFYLGDDGKKIKVQRNERAIGFPTPRLEVNF